MHSCSIFHFKEFQSTWHHMYHLVGSEADSSSVEITGGFTADFDMEGTGCCVKFCTGI